MKLNKYISLGAVALLAAGFTSCDSKNDPTYIPAGGVSDTQRVYFAKNAVSKIVSAEETSFDVLVYRPDLTGEDGAAAVNDMPAQTVTIASSCSESGVLGDLITIPSQVTFEAGSPNATIKVSYDPSKMQGNHYYPIVLTIDPEYANEYAISEMTLRVNKEEYTDWAPFIVGEETEVRNGQGSYTFTLYYGGTEDPVRVMSRYVPTNPDDTQFEFQWLIDNDDPSKGWETFMTASTKDGGKVVTVAPQHFTDNATYGAVTVADTYSYSGNDKYKGLTNFDPESGLFTLNLIYYVDAGSFGNGDEFLQLRGYKDTNVYELKLSALGQSNIEGKDYEMVAFDFTDAVDYVDYTVVKGELEEEEVAAIVEKITDPDQTEYTISTVKEPKNVALTFSSSATYTVVGVGYHIGNDGSAEAKCSASTSFEFVTFDPYANWTPITKDAVYTDYLIPYLFMDDITPFELTVQVDASDEFEGLYRITNPYAVFADQLDIADFGCIEFEMYDADHINFPLSDTGILYGGAPVEITSFGNYYMMNGYGAEDVPGILWGTYKDNKITLNALNQQNAASFLIFIDGVGYYFDYDFELNLKPGEAAAKPSAKNLSNIIKRQMMPMQHKMMPSKAFYKALSTPDSASCKFMRQAKSNLRKF